MLMLISPAKSLDFESTFDEVIHSTPDFLEDSEILIQQLRELSPQDVGRLMKISDKLADLNFGRFLNWQPPFSLDNAKQAVLAFQGDVYQGLQAETFTAKQAEFAQGHLRILSGLYGLLRPYDLIQPYRLEMGTKFKNNLGKDLYAFWGNKLTDVLNEELVHHKSPTVVNLASNEYFKSINKKQLKAELVTPVFKDYKNGQYKIISFYAKKARGLMAAYAIKKNITNAEKLKQFDVDGYQFSQNDSSDKEWVFLRKL
ncbi:MAG: peroxide stress protein YaaA [Cellvibrionales bacterium]|nr:peroxide stress protein YaaA [Cellvibrionales bacterium]